MEVYMVFLVPLLFTLTTEAPETQSIRYQFPTKYQHSTNYIPVYTESTSGTYEENVLPDGWFMQFYSNDLFIDLRSLNHEDVVRDDKKLSFVKSDHYSVDQGVHFMDAIQQTAKDHIKFYADYWHGKLESKQHKAYKTTDDKIKQLRSDKGGTTYQLAARMKTNDGSLQMCCNIIINIKWEGGRLYNYHCAEPTCYRVGQLLTKDPCFHLSIAPGALDNIHYKPCLKEIPFVDHNSQHHTSHPTTLNHNHHGVPHSSSVYGKTCLYDEQTEVEVDFLSINLDLDGVILAYPKITRHQKLISFTKDTRIIDGTKLSEFNRLMEGVAMSHIEVYADVMHGIKDQTHIVTMVDKKMCCNMLFYTKWHGRYDYEPFCAQIACFKPIKGAGTCEYLNMEHQINMKDFKTCWKEVK